MIDKKYKITADDMFNAGLASSDIKRELKRLNCSKDLIRRVSIASYEAEINIVIHSFGGEVKFKILDSIIYLEYSDVGPGIEDIELAMKEGYSTASDEDRLNGFGAGMGLPNIKKSADELDIISDKNGTVLKLRFYMNGRKNEN